MWYDLGIFYLKLQFFLIMGMIVIPSMVYGWHQLRGQCPHAQKIHKFLWE